MHNGGTAMNKSSQLFKPTQKEYDRRYAEAYIDGIDGLSEREQVKYRSLQGLLTGLDKYGLLADLRRRHWDPNGEEVLLDPVDEVSDCGSVCTKCYRKLIKGAVPKEALIAGTWQGLVPPELKNLTRTESSMVKVFNPILIIGRQSHSTLFVF